MAAASGSYKQVIVKKQPTAGVLPGATGARIVSRTGGVLNMKKELFQNQRIRSDLQPNEDRHGARMVDGSIVDHLAPGASTDFLGSALKRIFTAVTPMSGLSITIAAGSGDTWTLTRAAGSWLTSGLRIGMGARLTAGAFNAANINKTLFVVDVTALVATVLVANASALVAEGPIATATLTVPGKYSYMPLTGHVNEMYTVEEWQPDVPYSEVYTDWRPTSTAIDIPPNGIGNLTIQGEGRDLAQRGAAAYFTTPTAESNSPVLAGVNGLLRVGGVSVPVTSLQVSLGTPYTGDPTLGSYVKAFRFAETPTLTGSFGAYFTDGVLPDAFTDETSMAIDLLLTTSTAAACEFLSFSLPQIKVNSADKSDGKGGVIRTYAFSASANPTAGAREQTALAIHDSLAA